MLFLTSHLFLYLWWPISLKIKTVCHQRLWQYSVILQFSTDTQSLCTHKGCLHPTLLKVMHPSLVFSFCFLQCWLSFISAPSPRSPSCCPCISFRACLSESISWIVFISQTCFPGQFLFSCLSLSPSPFVFVSFIIC